MFSSSGWMCAPCLVDVGFSLSRTLTESYCCHSSILVLAARFVLLLLNFASGFQDFAIVLRKNFWKKVWIIMVEFGRTPQLEWMQVRWWRRSFCCWLMLILGGGYAWLRAGMRILQGRLTCGTIMVRKNYPINSVLTQYYVHSYTNLAAMNKQTNKVSSYGEYISTSTR